MVPGMSPKDDLSSEFDRDDDSINMISPRQILQNQENIANLEETLNNTKQSSYVHFSHGTGQLNFGVQKGDTSPFRQKVNFGDTSHSFFE